MYQVPGAKNYRIYHIITTEYNSVAEVWLTIQDFHKLYFMQTKINLTQVPF